MQQLGWIDTPQGRCDAMICFDDDRPSEALMHWWKPETHEFSEAALVAVTWEKPEQATLKPLRLYGPRPENGELRAVQPQPEAFASYTGTLLRLKNGSFKGVWNNAQGETGTLRFGIPPSADERLKATACSDWNAFKKWASESREKHDVAWFRGHGSSDFRLATSLHRAGRSRLERYCEETLPAFRAHAEAVLATHFDLKNGDDYATLLGLAQHHGLPTPLLDWTKSPYIAAFFAFSDALENTTGRENATHVRIYGLTGNFVKASSPPIVHLPWITPYICALNISARQNPRLYAQQGQFLVTNVADLERHLIRLQRQSGREIVSAADVPIDCAREALEDLSFMGLTAATMFPGLDGVCRMMRHEMSFKRPVFTTLAKPLIDANANAHMAEETGSSGSGRQR